MLSKPEYYNPGQIRYSVSQIKWLIPYLPMLRSGQYPPDHRESGYIGGKGKKKNQKAPFENPALIAAELDWRLQRAGWEGLITEMVYSADTEDMLSTMQHIAEALDMEVEEVDSRVKETLEYIRGFKRKQVSFNQFNQHKKGG